MSRIAILFLVFVTQGAGILLAVLGLMTLASNLLGWFLLFTGSIYSIGIVVVYWIRRIRFWGPRAGGETLREEAGDRSFWFIVAGMIAAFYLPPLEYLYSVALMFRHLWMQSAGLLMIVLGSTLFIWARRVLGKFYSGHISVVEGQPLVKHGPYRFIRHPAYAGYILIALGLAVGYSSVSGLVAVLFVLLPSVVYRIGIEDRLLAEYFDSCFERYAAATKRLIPYLW
jgi:protein-S-isoprenylcysteine O-methyltransferase Ste14